MFSGLPVGAQFYWRWHPERIYTKRSDQYAGYMVGGKESYQSIFLGEMVELVEKVVDESGKDVV